MSSPSSLVLAIEPDSRQAAILKRVVRERAHADITVVDSKDAAIATIAARAPDLILVTALLSPRDEEELVAHLRTLDEADHLQTITIPQLATAGNGGSEEERGFFKKFRRKKHESSGGVGCDPWAFADQVTGYLRTAAEARAARQAALAFERANGVPSLAEIFGQATSPSQAAGQQGNGRATEVHGATPEVPGPAAGNAIEDLLCAAVSMGPSDPAADVAELRDPEHSPGPADENPPEPLLTDPDYAFTWRTTEERVQSPRSQVRGPGSKVRGRKSEVRVPESQVRVPESEVRVPESQVHVPAAQVESVPAASVILPPEAPIAAAPEPVALAPEPVAFAPEPVALVPEPVAILPEPEPVAPEPVAFATEPAFAPEPVAFEPEPVPFQSDPIVLAPEFLRPEPVSAAEVPVVTLEPILPDDQAIVAPQAKPAKPHKKGWSWRKSSPPVEAPAEPVAARVAEPPPAPKPPPPVVLRPLKRLPPLAMWARVDEEPAMDAPQHPPHARHDDDDVAGLIGGLRVPPHVLAVSYPRRPHIHRVRSIAA